MTKRYIVTDGDTTLQLDDVGDGWFVVSSPFERGLNTQARTLADAFDMAADARAVLRDAGPVDLPN